MKWWKLHCGWGFRFLLYNMLKYGGGGRKKNKNCCAPLKWLRGGSGGIKTTAANIVSTSFSKNSHKLRPIIHMWNVFAYGLFHGGSGGKQHVGKGKPTRVIVAKTVITVEYLAVRSKLRSLWKCDLHSTTEGRPGWQCKWGGPWSPPLWAGVA